MMKARKSKVTACRTKKREQWKRRGFKHVLDGVPLINTQGTKGDRKKDRKDQRGEMCQQQTRVQWLE